MKITIYADTVEDADRAFRVLKHQDLPQHRDLARPVRRDCTIWSSVTPGDPWRAMIWGGPDHWRVDCRRRRCDAL